jgi:hypothetical protein
VRTFVIALGVLCLLLLTSCSQPGLSTFANVAGTWQDEMAMVPVCDGAIPVFIAMKLQQDQGASTISGTVEFQSYFAEQASIGTVVAELKQNTVTGLMSLTHPDGSASVFDFILESSKNKLQGKFDTRESIVCNGQDVPLTFEVSFITPVPGPVQNDSKEPNNAPATATMLEPGQILSDLTLSNGDVDWYKVTLDKTSVLESYVDLQSLFGVQLTLFLDTPQQMTQQYFSSSLLEAQVNQAALSQQVQPGTYYFAVSGIKDKDYTGNHQENGNYSFTVKATPVSDATYEPNDTQTAAKAIEQGKTHYLYLGPGDEDWLSFTLPTAQRVHLSYHRQARVWDTPQLINAQGQLVLEVGKEETDINLSAGQYYFKLASTGSQGLYDVTVTATDLPDSSNEPNDTRQTATPLELGLKKEAYLFGNDQDWFTFTLIQPKVIRARAEVRPGFSNNLRLSLYSQSDEAIYPRYSGGFTLPGEISPLTLAAGTYYVRVVSEYYYEDSYSLELIDMNAPDIGLEPNETRATAKRLPSQTIKHDMFLSSYDTDWFHFSTDVRTALRVTITYGGDFSILYGSWFLPGNDYGTAGNFEVIGPGTQIDLELEESYGRVGAYTIDVESFVVPADTYEPNNGREIATSLSIPFNANNLTLPSTDTRGVLSLSDDDWFTFTLTQAEQLNITATALTDQDSYPLIYLYDQANSQIAGPGIGDISLGAGTYYLLADSGGPATLTYALSIQRK